ncbi:MAG: methionine--tRNA ligase [Patescibacteria group bacterium]|jgi:methionyl-tRNA synthetase
MSKYYITTPIYYINDVPHIGHAYTTIAVDVLARYHRAKGDDVFFLTGTDEHGAKIAEAAEKLGKTPREFADELVPKFADVWKKLNISYDQFFRTTNPKHEEYVQDFVEDLQENGYIEKREYEGLYCVGCEKFLKESDLVEGCCPDHKKPPVKQKEENYFFKLSELQDKLLERIENGELKIAPESRKNEIVGKIKQGLEDVSISRAAVEWGVSYPGDSKQTIYVWIDALLNYYTACEIYEKEKFWPASLHLMAKDIVWFHAVIWPAMLIALDLPLPRKVFAHGFFTVNGQKMSKTIGNVIDPNVIIEKYGADAVRFYLLSAFPFGEDGDVSLEKLALSYNKLANDIGNLLQRTISMMVKYNVSGITYKGEEDSVIRDTKYEIRIDKELDSLDFAGALKKITDVAQAENKYIADREPWTLAKEGKTEELTQTLQHSYDCLTSLAQVLQPFMPETAEKMASQLKSLEPMPLFPRIES